jgi:hypothetical protein
MRSADQYRKLAAELKAKASSEHNQGIAAELDGLARSYLRLAEQAEQNSSIDRSGATLPLRISRRSPSFT